MTNTLVIDASVAVKWLVPEDLSDRADALISADTVLIGPQLVLAEIANAFWNKVRSGLLSPRQAGARLEDVGGFFHRLVEDASLLPDALSLACDLNHPVYDCLYLASALRSDARVVTNDERFAAIAEGAGFGDRVLRLRAWEPGA